jgi:hypothetical protein
VLLLVTEMGEIGNRRSARSINEDRTAKTKKFMQTDEKKNVQTKRILNLYFVPHTTKGERRTSNWISSKRKSATVHKEFIEGKSDCTASKNWIDG